MLDVLSQWEYNCVKRQHKGKTMNALQSMDNKLRNDFICATSNRASVFEYAEKLNDLDLVLLMGMNVHWRKEYLAEVIIKRLQHLKPQERVITYLQMVGTINAEYVPKALSKKSIAALISKGVIIEESKSRLRQDDM